MSKQQQQQGFSVFSLTKNKNNYTNAISGLSPPDPNETVSIKINMKTDEEIVAECGYIPDELLYNSSTTRRAKKVQKHGGTPPRPPNSFFIYARKAKSDPKYEGMQAKIRLKLIAEDWKNEPDEVVKSYEAAARLAKKKHAKIYKGYQFRRNPPKNKQKKHNELEDIPPDSPSSLNNSPPNDINSSMELCDSNNMQQQYNFELDLFTPPDSPSFDFVTSNNNTMQQDADGSANLVNFELLNFTDLLEQYADNYDDLLYFNPISENFSFHSQDILLDSIESNNSLTSDDNTENGYELGNNISNNMCSLTLDNKCSYELVDNMQQYL